MSVSIDWENGEPHIVESPTRIRLGPDAKFWAEQYFGPGRKGLEQFARYLLNKHRLGNEWQEGGRVDERYEQFPESENIEDARDAETYVQPAPERGWWNARKPEYAVDPRLIFEHEFRDRPTPLGNQLGYGSIGNSPPQAPYSGPHPLPPLPTVLRRRSAGELLGETRWPWLNFQAGHYLRGER